MKCDITYNGKLVSLEKEDQGLPWWPVVKVLPSSAWDRGLIPGRRTKIPHALWAKKQNVSRIVINSIYYN